MERNCEFDPNTKSLRVALNFVCAGFAMLEGEAHAFYVSLFPNQVDVGQIDEEVVREHAHFSVKTPLSDPS